ncbi:MAG: alpha/beta hydrolase [Spirochaetae bacterium HGW-Spirochaetae-5]|jgi:pimeloyl-ACP methyl ester carboxylesterase|nr:MAG: alpha/beta hydrolase [Spirochaetae bacterium HGW-Spirochaetae-5]
MVTLNLISGLGADERVYKYLTLDNYDINFIKWENPSHNETLSDYVKRLSKQINYNNDNILIGVSFGGIVAIELSKIIDYKMVIIISSVKDKYEIPALYRIIGKLGVLNLIPSVVLKSFKSGIHYYFGIKKREEKLLLNSIINETDSVFLKWALTQVMRWNNINIIDNLHHIHGNKDRLFPINKIKNYFLIESGHHFMIVSKSQEVSETINNILFKGLKKSG